MDAFVKKIGRHRGKPRVYFDSLQLVRAGFSPGEQFEVDVDGQRVTITKKSDGSRVVSSKNKNGKVLPVIDINSEKLLSIFEGMESIRVVFTDKAVYLLPMASEVKRVGRLARLREKLAEGKPLQVASLSHGGGILSHAIHQGLKDAGLDASLAVANEIREDLLMHSIEANDLWNDKTMGLGMPMQELMQDDWLLSKLPYCDILEGGIPCSAASTAGRARKGLGMMEDDADVGHLVVPTLSLIGRLQPALVVIENVVPYRASASANLLRYTLRDMGYDTHEAVIKGKGFGCLEDRVRWCFVAVTRGLSFDFHDIEPAPSEVRRLGEFMDNDIGPDDPAWRTFSYLETKRARDEEKGNRFLPQVVTPDSTSVPVMRKGMWRGGSSDPRIAHPTDPSLSRLITVGEHGRIKGVPEHIYEGLSAVMGHEMLGQAVAYEPFRAVGERIGQCLQDFGVAGAFGMSTPEAVREAISQVVQVSPIDLQEGIGKVIVTTRAELVGQGVDTSPLAGTRAKSFTDPNTGTTVLLADRIPAGREGAIFLQEMIRRHGRDALGGEQYSRLVDQVKAWVDRPDGALERQVHDAAAARVARAGAIDALADDELFAFAVEEAVARGVRPTAAALEGSAQHWLGEVEASVRRVGEKLAGNDLAQLDGQDLVDLAYALAQLDSQEHIRDVVMPSVGHGEGQDAAPRAVPVDTVPDLGR
ncbi:DNA cytosine methyltransferase [Paracidovorax wautersii]|uniref:C-5 cytosine-specific DNA methylase n=1 Tax=Paracidovorax wautersii TaxID=1177982 RepID=A0A1I2HW89_9BURK|nr:DNA cytosine methyltransferase [Paracidovorax wautersii]SFF34092.1 C-5 cytosine-specific DNA methylase [Paracidovorax wautersii]